MDGDLRCKWLGCSTEGGLSVLVAGFINGGRSEDTSYWLGCSMDGDLRVQVAGLFNGGRSEDTC